MIIESASYDLSQYKVLVNRNGNVEVTRIGSKPQRFERLFGLSEPLDLSLLEVELALPTHPDEKANPALFMKHTGLYFKYRDQNHTITSSALNAA